MQPAQTTENTMDYMQMAIDTLAVAYFKNEVQLDPEQEKKVDFLGNKLVDTMESKEDNPCFEHMLTYLFNKYNIE